MSGTKPESEYKISEINNHHSNPIPREKRRKLIELASLFLRLGFTAYGGPAAHIAMMRDEVVTRRKWMSDEEYLDLIGATNLIPGPNSTEMAIHIGYIRAGISGLIVAGSSFIFPAMTLVTALAWIYVELGTTPQVEGLLIGIKPVVIPIILQALIGLGRKAIKGLLTILVGIGVFAGYYLGVNLLVLLLISGLLVMLIKNIDQIKPTNFSWVLLSAIKIPDHVLDAIAYSPWTLFWTFLKIGSVLYGSGYVLLAFIETEFVENLGWLTTEQVIDAIAIGQVTPGPVFTTATFVGFLMDGIPGALIATLGIFIPSFIFVAISNPIIQPTRKSRWAGTFLDGVNAASLGLMAAVTLQLGRTALVDPFTLIIGGLAAILLFGFRVNTTWLILGGGVAGVLYSSLI